MLQVKFIHSIEVEKLEELINTYLQHIRFRTVVDIKLASPTTAMVIYEAEP